MTAERGLTLDTGVLIALERHQRRALDLLALATLDRRIVTVPAVALAEWWRGSSAQRRVRARELFSIESLDEALAEAAGIALANVRKATTNDAIVMASAARRRADERL